MAGAGRKDWTAGAQVAAADMDQYLMEQTVMQFATSAARDTALASILDEGLMSQQADSNCLTVYSGTAWSTTGPLYGVGLTWTPAVVQSGSVTSTVTGAKYYRMGRLVTAQCELAITGSGTATNSITVSLPVAAITTIGMIGTFVVLDSSAGTFYTGAARISTSTTVTGVSQNTAGNMGGAAPLTAALAAGDTVWISVQYEAAADA